MFCCTLGDRPAMSEPRDPLVRVVRAALLVEAVIPDVSVEFVPGEKGVGTTLAVPLLLRVGAVDFGELTARKYVFALVVVEGQLGLGRGFERRFRGLSGMRVGSGLYRHNLSMYLEGGYNLSQRSQESGVVIGTGIGFLPQHLASMSLVLRRYLGDESRYSVGIDFSMPVNLWWN